MKKQFSISTVTILFVVALLIGMQLNQVISGDSIFEQLNKFKDVLSLAEKYYIEVIDKPKLVEAAINGMFSTLDPHTVYIPAEQLQKVTEDFQGSFEGIGIEFDVLSDTIFVVAPIPGGPSEALGIMAGDKIIKINDTSAVKIKREDVPKKLRGPKGTRVKVTIIRAGEKSPLEFDIIRDKIPIYSVDVSFMVDDKTGYIRVNRFSQTTNVEFIDAAMKLRSKGMEQLILDLRDNSGGYLDQAYRMADELLPKGKKIVYTVGRKQEFNEEYVSTGNGRLTDIPLIILISPGSASASEIVSGAIQDWDRGLLVGERTFGKGLVQRQFELQDKSAIRLTIARYFTPSGRLIQRPYGKSRDEYRKAVDDIEGENIDHQLDTLSLEKSDSLSQIFYTAGGRKVYGGGGITPDYIIKIETLTPFTSDMRRKAVFLDYSMRYLEKMGKQIRLQYEFSVESFQRDFVVSDEMLKECIDLAIRKGVQFNEEHYQKDKRYIKAFIKSQIARNIWGNEGSYPIILAEDNQFQKALTLFPEAKKIAGLQ